MSQSEPIYILGAGAIGFPLTALLVQAGRNAVAVRTSRGDLFPSTVAVTVHTADASVTVPVPMVSLATLPELNGTIVITSKAYANAAIATTLREKAVHGPIVLLQNGIGVEDPFSSEIFPEVYRCVLYFTSQAQGEYSFAVRPVAPSPIGALRGSPEGAQHCVELLNTAGFPFRTEPAIQREIWKKAIINTVFNSICPLLEADNGIFVRDPALKDLAQAVVAECIAVTDRLDLSLSEPEVMEQLLLISRRSDGQLISTLQDLRSGRPTEIAFFNPAIVRVAAALEPPLELTRVSLLGTLVEARTKQQV